MARVSRKEWHRRGVDDDTLALAEATRQQQARLGLPIQSLTEIVTGKPAPKPTPREDLTVRQLRKHGDVGGAAVLLDRAAVAERDLIVQAELRQMSRRAKEIARKPEQLQFNFWKGNVSVGIEYWDTIRDRINALDLSAAKRMTITGVWAELIRHLRFGTSEVGMKAATLAELLKLRPIDVSMALTVLEEIGAIYRVKAGREKVIHINPEGAFRGNLRDGHAAAVKEFAKVVQFHPPAAE